jgi:hypothetical protein
MPHASLPCFIDLLNFCSVSLVSQVEVRISNTDETSQQKLRDFISTLAPKGATEKSTADEEEGVEYLGQVKLLEWHGGQVSVLHCISICCIAFVYSALLRIRRQAQWTNFLCCTIFNLANRFKVRCELPGDSKLSLANVFARIEEARDTLGIQDYAVSQTSLEQVFLRFAKRGLE